MGLSLTHPLLSPINASDSSLSALPPVRVSCGLLDPLLDDSTELVRRLRGLGKKVQYRVWRGLSHGFMNMGIAVGADTAVDETVSWLKEMFSPETNGEQEGECSGEVPVFPDPPPAVMQ